MERKPTIRWGMIGCGDVTERKSAPAYQQVEGFSLHGVCSRREEKAKDYAKRHNVPVVFRDPQSLIQSPEIDAVYIATPPDSHHTLALQVAQAGKPCCVEKPMAVNFALCKDMEKAFQQAQVPLFVAYYRRCLPAFNGIKTWLSQSIIGEVRHVTWMYSRPPSELDLSGSYNWRTNKTIAPGGYFDDIACHGLDLFTYLWGPAKKVTGVVTNQQHLYTSYDAIAANLLFESGITFSGHWNFAAHVKEDKVLVTGSKGSLEFSVFGETPALVKNAAGELQLAMEKPSPIQQSFVQAMADHLISGKPHPSQAASAAHTSWIMDQILNTQPR